MFYSILTHVITAVLSPFIVFGVAAVFDKHQKDPIPKEFKSEYHAALAGGIMGAIFGVGFMILVPLKMASYPIGFISAKVTRTRDQNEQ